MEIMKHHRHHHQRPFAWIFWPFRVLSRLVSLIVGFVFIVVGIVLSLTIIGAIVGIPLAIIGLLMVLRGIF
jgi:hypothetical protein